MTLGRTFHTLALLALGMVAASCSDIMTAGGSDEIDTSVGRVAVDRTGHPVAHARVALVRSGDSTGKALAVSAADSTGGIPTFRVPDGYYGLLLRDPGDTIGRFVDSLEVRAGALPSGRDTLLALGSVQGVVRLGSSHSPATVTLGLIGTDILANVRDDGSFRIDLVPGGVYTLGAFPSVEGYGPLYRRIQLRDGQTLRIPDTLFLPFAGLAAPGNLRALQDTATGDVRLTWSKVADPDLYGYLVEVLERGSVTRSLFTKDTTWTDSLGKDWLAEPLLGPWADREIVYRVASRSKSGEPDARSRGLELVAHPPAWTTRIDSVRLRQDTLAGGATRISWSRLPHAALVGWDLERRTGTSVDCHVELAAGDTSWSDSSCPERGWRKIDSGWANYSGSKGLFQTDTTTWTLSAKRTRGPGTILAWRERLAATPVDPPPGPVFEGQPVGSWSRTGHSSETVADRIRGVGNWLVHVVGYPRPWQDSIVSISLDGIRWESVGKTGLAVGRGDSLWIVRPRQDGMGATWERRTDAGSWASESIELPWSVSRINWAVRDGEGFLFGLQHDLTFMTGDYRSVRIDAEGWRVLDSAMDDEPGAIVSASVLAFPEGGYGILFGSYYPGSTSVRHVGVPPARMTYSEAEYCLGLGPSAPVGLWGRFPSSLFWAAPSWGAGESDLDAKLALADSTGNARVVRLPAGAGMPAVRGDELWVPVGDELWKGTIVTKQ